MVTQLIAVEAKEPYLAVTWQVNNFCNFRCSYCNEGNWSGSHKNDGNLDGYINNLQIIIDKYKKVGYKNFKFFLPFHCFIFVLQIFTYGRMHLGF